MNGTAAGRLTATTVQCINGIQLAATGGEQAHIQTAAEVGTHSHPNSLNDPSHGHPGSTVPASGVGGATNVGVSGAGGVNAPLTIANSTTGITITNANNTGAGNPFNVLPPGGISNIIIKR
jgi:hypothetical protein